MLAAVKQPELFEEYAIDKFLMPGKVSFIVGGQYGSEAKGSAAAWIATHFAKTHRMFDIVTTNAGAQAGHTSIHKGKKRVVFHLPTYPLIVEGELSGDPPLIYLNAGSVIDPVTFEKELNEFKVDPCVHPDAAIITDYDRAMEGQDTSAQTLIASTRKGVGEALANKVRRAAGVAKDHPWIKNLVRKVDLNHYMRGGYSVLAEVPQGVSLSLSHSGFYPYTTSRDCYPTSAMADAGIHPSFYNRSMVVLRTFPIRVGNIEGLGQSGGCYSDQKEITWEKLGVEAEITTVTKRVRRVFTFSRQQVMDTFALCRPDIVFLAFCNYVKDREEWNRILDDIHIAAQLNGLDPTVIYQWGPTTEDIDFEYTVL